MRLLVVAVLLAPVGSFAQYKCTGPTGSVSFQQTPCAAQEKQQPLKLNAAPVPAPAASPPAATAEGTDAKLPDGGTDSVYVRMARSMERDRRVLELERAISQTEYTIGNRNVLMANEMAMLRNQKRHANNNLAGATWEQSISTEMQAVAAKYKAMNDVDNERLKQFRSELADAKRPPASR